MARHFVVDRLGCDRAESAYPLARRAAPALTLEQWQAFLAAAEGSSRGVMAASNERGYIQGLCTYRAAPDLRHGASLEVDDFVVLDLVNGSCVALALLEALDDEARRQGCTALRLHLPQARGAFPGRHPLIQALCDAGHEIEAVRLIKPVEAAVA